MTMASNDDGDGHDKGDDADDNGAYIDDHDGAEDINDGNGQRLEVTVTGRYLWHINGGHLTAAVFIRLKTLFAARFRLCVN